MNKVFLVSILLLCTIVFQSSIFAQALNVKYTVKPNYICRYSNEDNGATDGTQQFRQLPADFFPWGVCLEESNLSQREKKWVITAIFLWNEGYQKYVSKRWSKSTYKGGLCSFYGPKKYVVDNIPHPVYDRLFVQSCDNTRYNIIHISKANLPWNKITDSGILGYWGTNFKQRYFIFDALHWNTEFYGIIKMQKRKVWGSKYHFINTVMHELGHALGIPHLRPGKTQVMNSHGSTKKCKKKKRVCAIQHADFNSFVRPYKPRLRNTCP